MVGTGGRDRKTFFGGDTSCRWDRGDREASQTLLFPVSPSSERSQLMLA